MVTKVKGGVLDESALSGKNMTGDIAFDTTTLKIDSSNNRVGVGTASPAALLHLSGDSDTSDEACQIVINDEDSNARLLVYEVAGAMNSLAQIELSYFNNSDRLSKETKKWF